MNSLPNELNKYGTKGEELGSGTYGSVFLFRKNNESYAVKIISLFEPDYKKNIHISNVAYNEIAIYSRLDHPNIIKLYEIIIDSSSRIYLVMEHIENKQLGNFIRDNYPKSWDRVSHVIYQILCGVAYLHSNNILHCDLHPNNIFINSNYQIKIADFGLSNILSCVDKIPIPEMIMPPSYRAPEIILVA